MDINKIYEDGSDMIYLEALYCIGGYVTYKVAISTSGFSGIDNFCIAEDVVKKYINRIEDMINSLSGEVEINDCESDAYLNFYFKDARNLYVSGQIGGSTLDNVLKFKLRADQTVLLGLKRNLYSY